MADEKHTELRLSAVIDPAVKKFLASVHGANKLLEKHIELGRQMGASSSSTGMKRAASAAAKLKAQLNKSQAEAKRLRDQLKRVDTATKKINTSTQSVLVSWRSVGRVLVGTIISRFTTDLVRGFQQAVKEAQEFSVKIGELKTINQEAATATATWSKELRALSDEFGKPAIDIAEAAYQTLSNQVAHGAEAIIFLREALQLARITVTDASTAVQALTGILNAYGLEAEAADRVSASLFKTIELGRLRLDQIAETIGNVAIIASKVGVSFQELEAAIATLSIQGVQVSQSQTFLRNVLLKMVRPTKAMTAFFHELGVSSATAAVETYGFGGFLKKLQQHINATNDPLGELGELFGRIRAIMGAAGLDADKFAESFDKISDAAYDAAAAQDEVRTAGRILQEEFTRIKNFFLFDFGEGIVNTVAAFSEKIVKLSTVIEYLAVALKGLGLVLGAVLLAGFVTRLTSIVYGFGLWAVGAEKVLVSVTLFPKALALATKALGALLALAGGPAGAVLAAIFVAGTLAAYAYRDAMREVFSDFAKYSQEQLDQIAKAAAEARNIISDELFLLDRAFSESFERVKRKIFQDLAAINSIWNRFLAEIRGIEGVEKLAIEIAIEQGNAREAVQRFMGWARMKVQELNALLLQGDKEAALELYNEIKSVYDRLSKEFEDMLLPANDGPRILLKKMGEPGIIKDLSRNLQKATLDADKLMESLNDVFQTLADESIEKRSGKEVEVRTRGNEIVQLAEDFKNQVRLIGETIKYLTYQQTEFGGKLGEAGEKIKIHLPLLEKETLGLGFLTRALLRMGDAAAAAETGISSGAIQDLKNFDNAVASLNNQLNNLEHFNPEKFAKTFKDIVASARALAGGNQEQLDAIAEFERVHLKNIEVMVNASENMDRLNNAIRVGQQQIQKSLPLLINVLENTLNLLTDLGTDSTILTKAFTLLAAGIRKAKEELEKFNEAVKDAQKEVPELQKSLDIPITRQQKEGVGSWLNIDEKAMKKSKEDAKEIVIEQKKSQDLLDKALGITQKAKIYEAPTQEVIAYESALRQASWGIQDSNISIANSLSNIRKVTDATGSALGFDQFEGIKTALRGIANEGPIASFALQDISERYLDLVEIMRQKDVKPAEALQGIQGLLGAMEGAADLGAVQKEAAAEITKALKTEEEFLKKTIEADTRLKEISSQIKGLYLEQQGLMKLREDLKNDLSGISEEETATLKSDLQRIEEELDAKLETLKNLKTEMEEITEELISGRKGVEPVPSNTPVPGQESEINTEPVRAALERITELENLYGEHVSSLMSRIRESVTSLGTEVASSNLDALAHSLQNISLVTVNNPELPNKLSSIAQSLNLLKQAAANLNTEGILQAAQNMNSIIQNMISTTQEFVYSASEIGNQQMAAQYQLQALAQQTVSVLASQVAQLRSLAAEAAAIRREIEAGKAAANSSAGGRFAGGGTASIGNDTVFGQFSPKEFITNASATRAFLPLLTAINSGVKTPRAAAGEVVNSNFGDINVAVESGSTPDVTARKIGEAIRRELKRGTLRLN